MTPSSKAAKGNASDRVSILKNVRTLLSFFVLLVLVVDGTVGALAFKGPNPLIALYGMFFFLAALIAVVVYLTNKHGVGVLLGKPEIGEGAGKLGQFVEDIQGFWWEKISEGGASAISWVSMAQDPAAYTVKLKGYAYRSDGTFLANWESTGSCISLNDQKVFYYWRNQNDTRTGQTWEGWGEIDFSVTNNFGGHYSDANLADLTTAKIKRFTFERCTGAEKNILEGRDEKAKEDLVRSKLGVLVQAAKT